VLPSVPGIQLDLDGPIVIDAKYSAHASLRLSTAPQRGRHDVGASAAKFLSLPVAEASSSWYGMTATNLPSRPIR
jgi:hypothetical protein